MTQRLQALVVVLLVAVAAIATLVVVRAFPPASKRPLRTLEAGRMADFEARFDAARDSTRILLLLSPT